MRAKSVLNDHQIPFQEINIDEDPKAAHLVEQLNNGMRSVPTILFPDDSRLVEPSNQELEAKLQALKLVSPAA